MAAELFVDSVYGSDANSGLLVSQAKLTLAAAAALITADGTTQSLYISGDYRDEQITLNGAYSNKILRQWPLDNVFAGDPPGTARLLQVGAVIRQARLRGDTLVTGSWTSIGDGVYTNSIPTGLTLSGLAYGYDTKAVTAFGQHSFGMVLVATAAGVTTYATGTGGAKGVFHYASGSGLITAYFGGDNPGSSGHAVSYMAVQTKEAAVRLVGCSAIVVYGLQFALYPVYAGQFGWAVRLEGSTGCTVENCTADAMGAHIYGTLGGSGNASGNSVINCTALSLPPNGTPLIWHQFNADGNLTGCAVSGGAIYPCRWLGIDGNVMHGRGDTVAAMDANAIVGCYAHSDTGTPIRGITMTGVTFVNVEKANGCVPFALDDALPVASANRFSIAAYPMLVDQCTVTDFGNYNWNIRTGHIAARRTAFSSTLVATSGFAAGGLFGGIAAVDSADYFYLFDSCTFVGSLDGTGNLNRFFNGQNSLGGTKRACFVNCSFYNNGTDTTRLVGFFDCADESVKYFEAIGCIFAHRVTGTGYSLYIRESATALAGNPIIDCLYWNIDSANGRYAQLAGYTAALWVANVDTSATVADNVLSASPYANTSTLALTSAAQAKHRATSAIVPSLTGINGMFYAGNFGASQYPLLALGRTAHAVRVRRVRRI